MDKQQAIEALRKQIEQAESNQSGFYSSSANSSSNELMNGDVDAKNGVRVPADKTNHVKNNTNSSAFNKIVGLINASEKSSCELRKRLLQAGFEEEETNAALTRAINCGLVDDMRYASILIRSRINQGWGLDGIERELLKNGIDPYMVEGWPDDFPLEHDEQVSRALELLERRPPHARNLRDAAYRKLVKRGYSSSIASQAAGIWCEKLTNL